MKKCVEISEKSQNKKSIDTTYKFWKKVRLAFRWRFCMSLNHCSRNLGLLFFQKLHHFRIHDRQRFSLPNRITIEYWHIRERNMHVNILSDFRKIVKTIHCRHCTTTSALWSLVWHQAYQDFSLFAISLYT